MSEPEMKGRFKIRLGRFMARVNGPTIADALRHMRWALYWGHYWNCEARLTIYVGPLHLEWDDRAWGET
jgi:hypothetical protein